MAAHACYFNFAFSVLKVNEALHPHRIQGVRKCVNQADRKTVQIYVGREVICFAEGLKQRGWKKEREQEGKTDICHAAPALVTEMMCLFRPEHILVYPGNSAVACRPPDKTIHQSYRALAKQQAQPFIM